MKLISKMALLPTLFIGNIMANTSISEQLPPVLNYYPDCNYEIIEKAKVHNSTLDPLAHDNKMKLINELRREAAEVGANAVIITKLRVGNPSKANLNDNFRKLLINAELIRNCGANGAITDKLTKYNDEGRLSTNSWSSSLSLKFSLTMPEKPKFERPEQTNQVISFDQGVYGIPLGTSYKEVRRKLGDPSVELNFYEQQLVLGYGRRHWFYFQNNELVRVQSNEPILNQTVLNQVPYWDFFDKHNWLIDGKVKNGDELSKVKQVLGLDAKLNKNEQLVISGNDAELILQFAHTKDHITHEKTYVLTYFDLQKTDYQQPVVKEMSQAKAQLAQVNKAYDKLNKQQALTPQDLDLNALLGIVWIEPTEQLQIYSDNLLLLSEEKQVKEIQLVESLFQQKLQVNQPWYIGKFGEGNTMAELRPNFGDDALELSLDVLIDTDDYELRLAFDDAKGEPELFEAKLKIY